MPLSTMWVLTTISTIEKGANSKAGSGWTLRR